MGRRRSASPTTRIVQWLFVLVWMGFLFYMISGYLKKPDDGTVAEGGQKSVVEETLPSNLTDPLTSNSDEKPNFDAKGPTAKEILDRTIAAYRNATDYSDQGELQLSHKIMGQLVGEQYPWSSALTGDGYLQSKVFDVSVQSNGKTLSCFVSEIRSENLKNQQLFLRGSQLLTQLYRDRIASYYLNGGERIPVNELKVPNSNLLAPLPLALLTNEISSPWFSSTSQPQRASDAVVDGRDCFVLRCPSQVGELLAWVDKEDYILRQARLPNSLLDPALATDPNVKELNLVAKFTGAKFDASSTLFSPVAPRTGTWPVREFVAPADPLPSNLLGELAPQFSLDAKRSKITDQQIQGKPMVLLFLDGGESDSQLIKKLDAVKKTFTNDKTEFAVVAGPRSIETSPQGSWRLTSSIQPSANRTDIQFLADMDGMAARSFELASLPSVVLTDSRSIVQYADLLKKPAGYNGKLSVSQKWDQRLAAAISAVKRGNNVADDMRNKYRSYLDQYFNDRDQRLVASWFPQYKLPNQQKFVATPVKIRREKSAQRSSQKLNPKMLWQSNSLKRPGNISIVPDANRQAKGLLILDGWQTVSLFSLDGRPISRKQLELPEGVAVTSIRPIVSDAGRQRFALYSVGGKQVFLFDQSMELVGTFPRADEARYSVLACEVLEGSVSRSDQLLVCFGGSGGANLFNPFSGDSRSVGDTAVRALALFGKNVLAADERTGALLSMDSGTAIDSKREYNHIESGVNASSVFAATAMNSSQEWSLVMLDRNLKETSIFPIAPAIFGNGLEPVSGVSTAAGKGIWAVADSSNRIYLVSDDGKWLGDMSAEGSVSGLQLLLVDGRTRLVVATDRKIECWELDFVLDRIGAIGGRRE